MIYVTKQSQFFRCTVCGKEVSGEPIPVERWMFRTEALSLNSRPNMSTNIPVGWSINGYNKGKYEAGHYDVRCCQ